MCVADKLSFRWLQQRKTTGRVNDTWGHDAGDKVSGHTGALLRATLRKQEIIDRIDDEKFCIMLPGSGRLDTARVAEGIRERLNSKEMPIGPNDTMYLGLIWG